MTSRLAALVLLSGTLSLMSTPVAQAQATGTTDVDIILDPLCILFHFSEVDLTLSASTISDLLTDATLTSGSTANGVEHFQADEGTVAVTAASSGSDLDATIGSSPGDLAAGLSLSAVDLNLLNCWAVRCIASATSNTYDIEIQRGDGVAAPANVTLTEPTNSDTILITDTGIRGPGVGAFTAEATPLTNPVPGLVNADVGDCQMTLDFSDADTGGTYSSAAGTDFTITLTHN
ncbi:MAG: hypothetical protein AAF560_32490 [Acidobacteriota bacterium]